MTVDTSSLFDVLKNRADFFKYLLVAAATYWIINFVLTPNSLSPLHQDDYLVLGAGYENFRWWVERPVSTNLAYVMGEQGEAFSFALVNFLTIAIPALVLYFVSQLLQIRFGWLAAIAYGVMVFSHMATFEHGKYLGLVTNLISHFFGCLALLGLLHARAYPTRGNNLFVLVVFALSVFAKEDFLLPPLLLLAYFGLSLYWPAQGETEKTADERRGGKKWWLGISFSLVAVACASVLFSFLIKNPFIAGAVGQASGSAHYAVSFNPGVLVGAFYKLIIEYSFWNTVVGGLSSLAILIFCKKLRARLILLFGIIVALILPYALISNHIFNYRAFAWLPWLSALAAAGIPHLWSDRRYILKFFSILLLGMALTVGYLNRTPRLMVAGWYESAQRTTQKMFDSLLANRAFIEGQPIVGIVGIEGLSPWSNNNGNFLKKNFRFDNHWIVFVEKSTMFFNINDELLPSGASPRNVTVSSISKLCDQPELMILKFDASGGAGVPVRAAELCKR